MQTQERPLDQQVALVTGAGRGIGEAIAVRLARMGARVVLTARDESRLRQVAAAIGDGGGQAEIAPCDLLDQTAVEGLAARVRALGRCDILVNCAGIGEIGPPLWETDAASFDQVIGTNLRAPFLLMRALAPLMIAARRGHIVNISSLAGKNPLPNGAVYAASKWGLNGLSISAAEELRGHGIRVSLVSPGSVNTHFGGSGGDAAKAARKLQPEDIAEVVATIVTQPPQSFISEVLMRPAQKS
jgi:3-oxoacyl-[acyl-carrier protein] reductase